MMRMPAPRWKSATVTSSTICQQIDFYVDEHPKRWDGCRLQVSEHTSTVVYQGGGRLAFSPKAIQRIAGCRLQ
jgi:hypothetical protein